MARDAVKRDCFLKNGYRERRFYDLER